MLYILLVNIVFFTSVISFIFIFILQLNFQDQFFLLRKYLAGINAPSQQSVECPFVTGAYP